MAELGFWNIAAADPERLALVEANHTAHTAGELLASTNQLVGGLRELGLEPGDAVAVLLGNSREFLEVLLAATQAGWHFVPVNYHLIGPEIAYIVTDSGAKAFIAHERYAAEASRAAEEIPLGARARFAVGAVPGFRPYSELKQDQPTGSPGERRTGAVMNYTSGTTGKPKGVARPLPETDPDAAAGRGTFLNALFGIEPFDDNVHLTVAPLYHTAAVQFTAAALHSGHEVVLMDKWTPEGTLERIADYRVTVSHMVPTMFHRLLQAPEDVRSAADVSSLRHIIHSAAPCPIPTKQRMLDWFGPIVWEYYAATEGGGAVASPADWQAKPGTVGRPWPGSTIKILDDGGAELPAGEVGTVWLSMGQRSFAYHQDPEKTRENTTTDGFFTAGDAGELDEDGYLFLRDRTRDVVIAGGVNIYPAEIESVLLQHPAVGDCAVFGVPNADLGEEIKATVQPSDGVRPGPELAAELIEFSTRHLAKYKTPRSVDFLADFPRDPNGKVYKRRLRDPYWTGHGSELV